MGITEIGVGRGVIRPAANAQGSANYHVGRLCCWSTVSDNPKVLNKEDAMEDGNIPGVIISKAHTYDPAFTHFVFSSSSQFLNVIRWEEAVLVPNSSQPPTRIV